LAASERPSNNINFFTDWGMAESTGAEKQD
jgi:hypothetical protein